MPNDTPTAAAQSFALVPAQQWVASRDATLATLGSIAAVDSTPAYDAATATLAVAKKLRRELEAERKLVTSRLDAAKKALIAREREIAASLDAEIDRVNRLAADFAAAEMRRREEEQRRIDEERRRAAEAALAAQQAAEEAAASGADPDPFGIGAPAPAPEVPAVAVPATDRPKGVVMRLRVQLIDEKAVPREFMSFDEGKALAWAKYQKSLGARVSDLRADGLRFYEEATVTSR